MYKLGTDNMSTLAESAVHQALQKAHQASFDAFKDGELDRLLSYYTDDIVLMPPNDPGIYGKPEAADWFKEYFAHFKITAIGFADSNVIHRDDLAIERVNYHVSILPLAGGDRIVDEGRFLTIWKRAGDEWRIAQQIWNSSRPIGSGTSRFMALLKQRLRD